MEIFITGATGVLGRPVLHQLIEQGHQVRALARSAQNVALVRKLGATAVLGGLWQREQLYDQMHGCEAVLHLATKIPSSSSISKRPAWAENDHIRREGTQNIVQAALAGTIQTVMYPSICFVYPDSADRWLDATTAVPVIADYYQSTFDAEAEVQHFTDAGRRGIVLRMGFFYGPTSPQSQEQLRYARWGIATTQGQAAAHHPFITIADAARAVVVALAHAPTGIYDITEDEPPTTATINKAMATAVGKHRIYTLPGFLMRQMMGREINNAMSRSQRVSNRRFKDATGWQPQNTCDTGWMSVAAARRGAQ